MGGGKASVEAMGSGTPLVMHRNPVSGLLGGGIAVYPEAPTWETADEFLEIFSRPNREELVRQSRLARRHYLDYHHPNILRRCLALGVRTMEEGPVPVKPSYSVEPLQLFWRDTA
jgi:glycosyltransferase involved in cell wall biosynthesis